MKDAILMSLVYAGGLFGVWMGWSLGDDIFSKAGKAILGFVVGIGLLVSATGGFMDRRGGGIEYEYPNPDPCDVQRYC